MTSGSREEKFKDFFQQQQIFPKNLSLLK